MMDWDEVNRTARRFMKGMLGSGYIEEYYQQFADELTADLKACETPDPEPVHTHDAGEYRDPESGEVASAEASKLRAQLHDATQSVTITKLGDSSVYVGMSRADAVNLHAQLTRELGLA